MFKLTIAFSVMFVGLLVLLIMTILKVGSIETFLETLKPTSISVESRNEDMKLFNSELDKIFYIVLYRFITNGIEFKNQDGVVFKTIGKMDYRKMLEAIYCNETIETVKEYDDEGEVIASEPLLLKNLVIESVYNNFVSKVSKSIKNLYYKYYSGYDTDTYFVEKRGKPSMLPYIAEYINGKICLLYLELLANDQKIFNEIQQQSTEGNEGSSSKYTTALNNWSEKQFTNLSLIIYNIYGSKEDLPSILRDRDAVPIINKSDGGKE